MQEAVWGGARQLRRALLVLETERGPECESLTEGGTGSVSNNRNNKNLSEHFHILRICFLLDRDWLHMRHWSHSIVQLKISPGT